MKKIIVIEQKEDMTGFHCGVEGFTPEEVIAALRMIEGGILKQCFKPKGGILPVAAMPHLKP